MLSTKEIIWSVLPPYLLLLIGVILRRVGVLRRDHDEATMHVAFHVMYPCFLLDKILGSSAVRNLSAVTWPIAVGFLLPVAGIAIGWVFGKLIGLEKGTGRRTFALSSGLQNFGYTAIPVVEKLWSAGAVAVLAVHNLGVELAVWSVGVMLLSGSNTFQWRKLVNGPVFAVVGGLLLVATGIDQSIVGPPREAIHMLGSGAFPVAIMLTGAILLDLAKNERPSWKVVVGGALVRLVLSPLVILSAAKFLPVAIELKQVLVVQAAMPAAMTPILLARLYGGRAGIAVQVVVATTVLSLLTIPWVITWGSAWVGLKPGLH
ncbi:AEC family transporter [Luteolibacter sp. LG18]|uniref:AEC family transporter n=1 Tax=Luteolibacter sp. LG18 TaxID=2819286 RepID=UPI0030C65C86